MSVSQDQDCSRGKSLVSWISSGPFLLLTLPTNQPWLSEMRSSLLVHYHEDTHCYPIHDILHDNVPVEPTNTLASTTFVSLNHTTQSSILQLRTWNLGNKSIKSIKYVRGIIFFTWNRNSWSTIIVPAPVRVDDCWDLLSSGCSLSLKLVKLVRYTDCFMPVHS